MRVLVTLAVVALVLSGCTAGTTPPQETDDLVLPEGRARAVVALIDTGINPYHAEFRDPSDDAHRHPSEYLDGFPADAPALHLTLDAASYEEAVLADCAVWESVKPHTLYWIPGTRIVAAMTTYDRDVSCSEDALPGLILDQQGHGTMVASRAAGATTSVCPDCKIVALQGFSSDLILWSAKQPFIDTQSNSWGALPINYGTGLQGHDRDDVRQAAAMQPVFVAGGNGLLGFYGVTGHPAYFDDIAGPEGILMVGGHNNGRVTPWTMTMPHVVADADGHPAAARDDLEEVGPCYGGGTSGATPFAAGTFARMVLEAREAVDDHGTGMRDGALVVAPEGAVLPDAGPLAEGRLGLAEAKAVFLRSADPRPQEDGDFDGPDCGTFPLYPTVPVQWQDIPEDVPAYYFVGYGQVGGRTLQDHIDAVLGVTPVPERPMEDGFHHYDTVLRQTTDG